MLPARRVHISDLNNVKTDLKDEESDLSFYLKYLSPIEKSHLIAAIVSLDLAKISQFFQINATQEEIMETLVDSNFAIGKKLIRKMLLDPDTNESLSINEKKVLLSSAMQLIPDTIADLYSKAELCRSIDEDMEDVELRVAYNESVKPLKESSDLGYITQSDYKTATKNQIDQSEYILLTLGLLQELGETNPQVSSHLTQIRRLYLNLEFTKAIEEINTMLKMQKDVVPEAIVDRVIAAQARVYPVNIDENYARRFFENRIAALYQGMDQSLDSINEITKVFFPEVSRTLDQANTAMLRLSELYDETLLKRMDELKSKAPSYGYRIERDEKQGFSSKIDEASGEDTSDSVLTRNLGTMKSIQPNYPNELSNLPLRNSPADIYQSSAHRSSKLSPQHTQGPFVASVSGHAFFMVAVLEQYMKTFYDKNPTPSPGQIDKLQTDINNFIQAYVAMYVGRGYHSLLEMTAVMSEPAIKKIFNDYGVNIDANFSDKVLNSACKDSQSYTKNVVLKRVMHQELTHATKHLQRQSLFGGNETTQSSQSDIKLETPIDQKPKF